VVFLNNFSWYACYEQNCPFKDRESKWNNNTMLRKLNVFIPQEAIG